MIIVVIQREHLDNTRNYKTVSLLLFIIYLKYVDGLNIRLRSYNKLGNNCLSIIKHRNRHDVLEQVSTYSS